MIERFLSVFFWFVMFAYSMILLRDIMNKNSNPFDNDGDED